MVATAILALLIGLGGVLVLYHVIESETSDPQITDRESAQREAMARSGRRPDGDRAAEGDDGDESGASWGHSRLDEER